MSVSLPVLPLPTERQVQRSILRMMGTCFKDVLAVHVPNGAHLAGNDAERSRQMGALLGDGLKKGFPDVLCLWSPGKGALLEIKRPKLGRLSSEQEAMHETLRRLRWPIETVTSQEDAYQFLVECGAPCSARLVA